MDLGIGGLGDAEVISNGRSAVVYSALRMADDVKVAIRVLTISDPSVVDRFGQKIAALSTLSAHPGIVTIHETGATADGRPFLVVDYCPTTLADRIAEDGRIEPKAACGILNEVTSAIHAAHTKGVVHGDLRPENIFRSMNGDFLVGDFGLEEVLGAEAGSPTVNVGYTPPEFLDDGRLSAPSDVYGLGVLLFNMVTGAPPFGDLGLDQTDLTEPMEEYLTRRLESAEIDPAVADIVMSAMCRHPEQRPRTAELLTLLERQLDPIAPPAVSQSSLKGPSDSAVRQFGFEPGPSPLPRFDPPPVDALPRAEESSRTDGRDDQPVRQEEAEPKSGLEALLEDSEAEVFADGGGTIDPNPTEPVPIIEVPGPAQPSLEELARFAPPVPTSDTSRPDDVERAMFDRPAPGRPISELPKAARSDAEPVPVEPVPGEPDVEETIDVDPETAVLLQSLQFEAPGSAKEAEPAERLPEVDLLLSHSHQVLPEVVTAPRYYPAQQPSLLARLERPMHSISRLLGGLIVLAAPILVGLLIYLSQRDATPVETVDLGQGSESSAVPTIVIPPSVGLAQSVAITRLENASLEPQPTFAFAAAVPAGVVISTTPGTGEAVELGTEINVVVSLGTEPICEGLTEPAVRRLLDERKIEVISVTEQVSETVNTGTVIECRFDLSDATATVLVSGGPDTDDDDEE